MEQKSNAERYSSVSVEKASFSNLNAKLIDNVNELCNCDGLDENSNEMKRDDCVYSAHGNATSDYSIASLVPEMKNLQLSRQHQEKEQQHLAGYIKAVIPPSAMLVIQHASGSKILDVGTLIFARRNNSKDYEEIGFISEIFGSVNEPMYAVQMKHNVESEFLKLDSEVFYLHDHSSTRFISVECDGNDRYTVMYS